MPRVFTVHTPLGPEALKFKALSGQEQLSRLFEFRLEMVGVSPDISVDSLLGQNVTVEVETQALGRRYLNGEVTRFALIGRDGRLYRYEAVVRPWVWYMTRASDCKIFQQMDAPTILSEVFGKYPYVVEKRLSGGYRTWDYCVQYQETDFNFVSRLMEHEGIYYFFEHELGQLKLVLADSPGAHQPLAEYASIPYIAPDAATFADEEHVQSWIVSKEVNPGGFVTDDFDFRKPRAKLQQWNVHPYGHPNADYRIYDYPGGYTEIPEGEFYTKVRLEELQASHELLQGQSDARGIAPGYLFNLYRCPRADQNREYLIVGADYFWRENPYATAGDEGTRFQFTLNCQDSSVTFRPQRTTPKPLANGPQTAVVVGPKDDEIYTDKYGRVKVQFHWDRYGEANENSSCWIRVSSSWAGNAWGQISLPRIGQEVIVDFINGDPDYPIIIGRVYNADHMPPYELPKYQEYSTIKSRSTKKGGNNDWNELRFVDYKGKEQVFIHAQWRMDVRVKWKMYETILEWRHTGIHKGYALTVGGGQHNHVGGSYRQRVDDKVEMSAGGDIGIVAESSYALQATSNVEVNAKNITLESSIGLTLKVGSNYIKIDPGGVTIQGTLVRINSGGVATGTGPLLIDDPSDAEAADDGTPGFLDRPKPKGGGAPPKKRGGPGQHAGMGYASAEAAAVAAMQGYNPASVAQNREFGGWIKKNPDGTFTAQPAVRGSEAGLDNMPDKGANDVAWWHTHGAVVPDGHGGDKYDSENFSGADGDKGYSKANNATGYVATPSGAIKSYDPSADHGAPGEGVTTLPDTAPP
jgi:type VI secretion system secreted protein VgrG